MVAFKLQEREYKGMLNLKHVYRNTLTNTALKKKNNKLLFKLRKTQSRIFPRQIRTYY